MPGARGIDMRIGVGGGLFGVRAGVSTRGFGFGVGPVSAGGSFRRRKRHSSWRRKQHSSRSAKPQLAKPHPAKGRTPAPKQSPIEWVRENPRRAAWTGFVVGFLIFVTNIAPNPPGGLIGLALATWCTAWLIKWRRDVLRARDAEVAARADAQHQAYLAGDDFGVYGTRDMPEV